MVITNYNSAGLEVITPQGLIYIVSDLYDRTPLGINVESFLLDRGSNAHFRYLFVKHKNFDMPEPYSFWVTPDLVIPNTKAGRILYGSSI